MKKRGKKIAKEEEEKKGGKIKEEETNERKKVRKKIRGRGNKLDLFVFFFPLKQMCHFLLLFF